MIVPEHALPSRASELRRAFDQSFADAPGLGAGSPEGFLVVRIGTDAYALRLSELSGLYADRHIVPLPGPVREFLGVASFRGSILPVYGLRELLGYPADPSQPRWLVLLGKVEWIGLAFDQFQGHLRVRRDEIAPAGEGQTRRLHVQEAIRSGESILPILNLSYVLEEIKRRSRSGGFPEER